MKFYHTVCPISVILRVIYWGQQSKGESVMKKLFKTITAVILAVVCAASSTVGVFAAYDSVNNSINEIGKISTAGMKETLDLVKNASKSAKFSGAVGISLFSNVIEAAFPTDSPDAYAKLDTVLEELGKLSDKMSTYHQAEVDQMKVIIGKLDNSAFLKAADTVQTDTENIIGDMTNAVRHCQTGYLTIDDLLDARMDDQIYQTYQAILDAQSLTKAPVHRHFTELCRFITGTAACSDTSNGYETYLAYLKAQTTAAGNDPDSQQAIQSYINRITMIQAYCTLDYTILTELEKMEYKSLRYETEGTTMYDKLPAVYETSICNLLDQYAAASKKYEAVMLTLNPNFTM